ncbi:hypothetical protein SAMN04244559_01692 [Magnetospirillum fulvum]|uniref:Uncharacterized protein n=2 Tax=Magnetospirillum fulvum TaxID=1082 RepID=A0A1H6HGY5_MAGFU|nr:hypothetical protein SAMN04244559_01692 [Magnetospirillum fulvum]
MGHGLHDDMNSDGNDFLAPLRQALHIAHGPVAISLYNIFILYIVASSLVACYGILVGGFDIISHEIEAATGGISTILVGYGVVLESRRELMEFYRIYPKYYNEFEGELDAACHGPGLIYLVLGLLVEIIKEVITAPNNIINTDGADWPLTVVAVIFLLLSSFVLVSQSFGLIRMRFFPARQSAKLQPRH